MTVNFCSFFNYPRTSVYIDLTNKRASCIQIHIRTRFVNCLLMNGRILVYFDKNEKDTSARSWLFGLGRVRGNVHLKTDDDVFRLISSFLSLWIVFG